MAEISVDAELAARAASIAAARGERIEDVIERALRVFVDDETPKMCNSASDLGKRCPP